MPFSVYPQRVRWKTTVAAEIPYKSLFLKLPYANYDHFLHLAFNDISHPDNTSEDTGQGKKIIFVILIFNTYAAPAGLAATM